MTPDQRRRVRKLATRILGQEKTEQILTIPFADQGWGYDQFGQERESGLLAYLILRVLYKYYFRVNSVGHDNIPDSGPAILAGNHSGFLPFDGMMVGIDLMEKANPPRAMRAVAEMMLADVPWLSVLVHRVGQVIGHRRNFEDLLSNGDLVAVFPEGARGMGKTIRKKYQLQRFNVGFIEIALSSQVPIIPFAVVGAEEQTIVVANLDQLARRLNLPILPVIPSFLILGPAGLWPLPVKYHIRYGKPIDFSQTFSPDDASDPTLVENLAREVQGVVQGLVDSGLNDRNGIFR